MKNNLLFDGFLQVLNEEFGYHADIDKFKLFITAFRQGDIPVNDLAHFKRICRFLFLEKQENRAKFDILIDKIIEKELNTPLQTWSKLLLEELKNKQEDTSKSDKETPSTNKKEQTQGKVNDETGGNTDGDDTDDDTIINPAPIYGTKTIKKYLDIGAFLEKTEQQHPNNLKPLPKLPPSERSFLHVDEYFPMTRRQMIKTWHFLRRKEKMGCSTTPNINATIQKIAKDGIFTQPVYETGIGNRKNTLVILVDRRGSMVPFHELTNRIVSTALNDGGLVDTKVFYFQNYPLRYLYKTPDLSGAIKIEQAFCHANPQFTVALVISDAGAARGNYVEDRVRATVGSVGEGTWTRKEPIPSLLTRLQQHFAYISWLNPMPRHRWEGTSAAAIAAKVGNMFPLFDEEQFDFQQVIHGMMSRSKQ